MKNRTLTYDDYTGNISVGNITIDSTYMYMIEKYGMIERNFMHSYLILPLENIKKDFEIAPIPKFLRPGDKDEKLEYKQNVYKLKNGPIYIKLADYLFNHEVSDLEAPEGYLWILSIYYNIEDDITENINYLNSIIKEHKLNTSNKVSIVMQDNNGLKFVSHSINPLPVDIDKMYNDDFKDVYEHILDSLNNNNKGILMLHGAPGSGKTNLIKHLTSEVEDKKFVFIPVTMISSLADPQFLQKLIENKGSILVLEDCENFIEDRENSPNDVVSTILNISDGMLSDIIECQIICTFNSDFNKVDRALTRDGRLIAEYEFRKLSKEKVKELIGVEEEMTLAEALNFNKDKFKSDKERTKIGFG